MIYALGTFWGQNNRHSMLQSQIKEGPPITSLALQSREVTAIHSTLRVSFREENCFSSSLASLSLGSASPSLLLYLISLQFNFSLLSLPPPTSPSKASWVYFDRFSRHFPNTKTPFFFQTSFDLSSNHCQSNSITDTHTT